jgi:hypothetical protein
MPSFWHKIKRIGINHQQGREEFIAQITQLIIAARLEIQYLQPR